MQIHAVEYLCPYLEKGEIRSLFVKYLPPSCHCPMEPFFLALLASFRRGCVASLVYLPNWHYIKQVCTQSHTCMFNRLLAQSDINGESFMCLHFVSFSDVQHRHPSAGLSRYGYGDVQRGEDTCRHAWLGRHGCLQRLCPSFNSGAPRR